MRTTARGIGAKQQPRRNPIQETDLLRLVDAAIFGDNPMRLTLAELAEARKKTPYQMLQRVGVAMYRAGEMGLRPRPVLMSVVGPEKAAVPPVSDEQLEVAAAQQFSSFSLFVPSTCGAGFCVVSL